MQHLELLQPYLLALIQGLTEFLPISSSAHLIIPSKIFGWPDQGLGFDIAVHIGSLLAVVIYFRSDLQQIIEKTFTSFVRRQFYPETHLAIQICIATLPIVAIGFLFKPLVETDLRTIQVIAWATIVFGILMGIADRYSKFRSNPSDNIPGYFGSMIVGLAQVMALIPGTSRSGITITAALFLGMTYQHATRFAFLISIPVIAGAGLLGFYDAIKIALKVDWYTLALSALISGLSAYLCIGFFIRLISWTGLLPYVYYRLTLGLVILIFL